MLPKFKYIQQLVSQFRSQATLGRYAKSLATHEKLQQAISNLKGCADPPIKAKLLELEGVIEVEKRLINQLETAYPPVQLKQPEIPEIPLTKKQSSNTSQNSKWSKQSSFRAQSSRQNKEEYKLTEEEEMYYQHLLEETDQFSIPLQQYVGQESAKEQFDQQILLPFKMPKFYRKVSKSSILLYGHDKNGKTTLVKSISSSLNLKYLHVNLLSVPPNILEDVAKLTRELIRKKESHVFHFSNIHSYSQKASELLLKLCQFHTNNPSKCLIVATTSKPSHLSKKLIGIFSDKIHIQLLGTKQRKLMIDSVLGPDPNIKQAKDLETITKGVTSGKLSQMCKRIKKQGFCGQLESLQFFDDSVYQQPL